MEQIQQMDLMSAVNRRVGKDCCHRQNQLMCPPRDMLKRSTSEIRDIQFACLSCEIQYDENRRAPMILCPAQHTCCLECVEHKLFKDKAEGETVNCPECKHLISKGQLKKFNYLGEIRETVVRLKDGHHAKEENVSKEAENLEEELSKERQKNEWLLQQNIGIQKKYYVLLESHRLNQIALEARIKKDQASLERLSLQLWEIKGDGLFAEDKVGEAIDFCQSIIKTGSKHDYGTTGLGNIQEQIGLYERNVFEWYKNYKTVHKVSSSPYDLLSLCYSYKQNYAQAIDWYNSRLSKNHDSYQLLFGLANALYNKGRYTEAEQIYLRIIQLKPDLERPYQQIAFIKVLKQDKRTEVQGWIEKVKTRNTGNFYVDYIAAISEENSDLQIEKLTRLSQTSKQYARVYYGLANAHKAKKQYEQSSKFFKKAIEINHRFYTAYYGLGVLCTLQEKGDEAINWFHESIKVNHSYDKPYYGLASVHSKKGETEEAIKWHRKCIEVNPNNISALNALGTLLASKEHYDEAVQCFSRCVSINPNYAFALNGLGNVYYHKEKYDEAITYFTKCLEINPKNNAPYNGLSNIYSKKGDEVEARAWYERKLAALSV